MFLVLGYASDRSASASRPKSAAADFVEQASVLPIRHRHPCCFVVVERSSLRQQGMAVPEG